jgi:nicotinate phosphoribosyltransferase
VRFDTPGSRRGNFYRILEETRWELDLRGFKHVKFFVSGGIKEQDIPGLNPMVQGYGIGTSISNAPVVDFAMDIVEVDGKPLAKRGKWSGSKRVLVCSLCGERKIVPNDTYGSNCSCGGSFNDLLVPALDHGQQPMRPESPARIRQNVLDHVHALEL